MTDPRPRLAALGLVLVLAGCQRVVFDEPPAAAECDGALAGRWASIDAQPSAEPARAELLVEIDRDCLLKAWDNESAPRRPLEPTRLHSAYVDGRALLWLDAGWAHRAFDLRPGPLDDRTGIYVLAYRLHDGELELRQVSAKALAPRVLAEDIAGELLKRDSNLTVRVGGERDNSRAALALPGVFDGGDPLRLRRATDKDWE